MGHISDAQRKALAVIPHATGPLSLLGSLSIIYDILFCDRQRKLSRPYYRFILGMSCADAITSLWLSLSTWPIPEGTPGGKDKFVLYCFVSMCSLVCRSCFGIFSVYDNNNSIRCHRHDTILHRPGIFRPAYGAISILQPEPFVVLSTAGEVSPDGGTDCEAVREVHAQYCDNNCVRFCHIGVAIDFV